MTSLRRRAWSTVAATIGVLLILTGLSTPAQAVTTRTISLSVKPTAAPAGSTFLFFGYLSKSPTGSTVKLQRRSGSSWLTSTSTKTANSAGYFSFRVAASSTPGAYYYRTVASATSSLSSATSRTVTVTALRKVSVTIKASPSTIELGEKTTISGTVRPFVAGDVGFIQRFNGAKWIDLTTATLSSTGTYRRTLTPQASTTYRFYVPRQGLNASGHSAGTRVSIPTGPVPPVITTTSMPDGITETFYSKTLAKTGEAGTWAVTSGALPPGLSLGSSSGTVSGTPTAGGTFNFTVTFSQTGNLLNDSQALSIKIVPRPKVTSSSLPVATAFSNYSTTLTKTGGAGTWAVSGSLPAGVTFDTATGVLSGRPTVSGNFPLSFSYTETSSGLTSSPKALTLTVDPAPDPTINTTSLPEATAFSNYSKTLSKTGNDGTWSVTGSLPTGITFDTATGTLSGKPTVSGTFNLTFRFTETESGTFDTKLLPLKVNPAPDPTITTTSLPNAQAFKVYSATLAKTGNAGTWSLSSGSLPSGLSLDPATGEISGKPTVSGDFSPVFRFTETESGTFDTKLLPLHVNPAPDPVITSTSPLPSVLINTPYSAQLSKTGNAGTWSITSGALPAGLTLDADTGLISGTPTVSGTFGFTARFTETESGTFASKAFSLQVYSRPTITTVGLPDALNGNSYSASLSKTGGSGSGTWSISAGSLPPGLSLSTAGVFSGTSTVNGDYSFTVRFVDSVTGAATTKVLSIHVGPTAIRTGSVPDGKVGVAYSFQMDAAPNGIGGFSLSSGALPPGLSLSGSGVISGSPTAAGDYTFSVTYAVLLKPSRTRTYTLHVAP